MHLPDVDVAGLQAGLLRRLLGSGDGRLGKVGEAGSALRVGEILARASLPLFAAHSSETSTSARRHRR